MTEYQAQHSELWKNLRQVEISSRRLIDQLLSGQYTSVFKGIGLEFEEVRPYHEGDDERHIDWNVTARTGQVHIKRFIEEREQSIFLLVDISPSVFFGSSQRLKMDLAIEFAAVMAFSALRSNDRVGLMTFDSQVRQVIPPRKGRRHALRVLRELMASFGQISQGEPQRTDLSSALNYVNHILHRQGIIMVISDFIEGGDLFPLKVLNRRHDCIAVRLEDPHEAELPDLGWIRLRDPESGEEALWDLGNARVRKAFAERQVARKNALSEQFKRMGVDQITLDTETESVWKALVAFYERHGKQRTVKR